MGNIPIITVCLQFLAPDADLRDAGVRQVPYDPELCSFRFTRGQCSLEVQYVAIASCVVGYNETFTAYRIYIPA